ncbi:urease accessory protein UreE [Tropicimonas sp. TH_r6]|uniref:urease accessory protein UreE n=1 Tax=Tropicimonas sp. TH_r6 TaxID=3082085 RepID=UPI00295395C4|nr:urease accessory protein UreE [Tropicimonas sp. TH_r6]MDV7145038.1 urease accessory protein UreE [Tropicimonas sp. TH_r6]
MERAVRVERQSGSETVDSVLLDYEGRFLRRKRLETASGTDLLVDLPETVSLEDGDALVLESGAHVAIVAAQEPLLSVTGANLARLAWHVGNRHTPCRIEADRLLIREDRVLAQMLEGLGATVAPISAPFTPEGGAYGHGRTLGHSHGEDGHHAHEH